MKLVTGLGNIGEKYCFTRHNAGFMAVDKWALNNDLQFREEKKFKALMTKFNFNGEDVIIAKPTTFMNLSGEAVGALCNFYKIDAKDILVIYDDIAIDLGRLRFRKNGSDGGHNGIKSIIKHLGTSEFARLKIGIGPQPPIPSENYVLGTFTKEQTEILKPTLSRAVNAIECYLTDGIEKAQNIFN